MTADIALPLPVIAPLFAGLFYWLACPRAPWIFRWMTLLVCLAPIPMVALVYAEGSIETALGGWTVPLGIRMAGDGLSALFLIFHSLVGLAVAWNASDTLADVRDDDVPFFPVLFFLCFAALNALPLSRDIFNLYVLLELLSMASVGLILLSRTRASLQAAVQYLLLALVAGLLYLLGTGLLYASMGTLDLNRIAGLMQRDMLPAVALIFLISGLVIKSALFPVHTWLPPAHANAKAPASAILSGLVVTAAYLVILRLWTTGFQRAAPPAVPVMLSVLGAVSVLWGGWMAQRQERLKQVLAYSTVSQTGYLFLVFALQNPGSQAAAGMWAGTVALALGHGLSKAGAFLAAGMLAAARGSDRLEDLRGAAADQPFAVTVFAIAAANLAALPPGLGFFGKWLLLKASFDQGQWLIGLTVVAGGVLAVAYLLRPMEIMLRAEPAPLERPFRETGRRAALPVLLLVLVPFILSWLVTAENSLLRAGAPFEVPALIEPVEGGAP